MPPYPLTNFKIQKYYQSESKFNGVYSENNLSKIKDRAYITNLEYESVGTHWIALHVNVNNVAYFDDSFGVEHIPKKIENS